MVACNVPLCHLMTVCVCVCVCVCGAGTAIIASKQPFICGRRICAVRQITPQKDSHGETEIIEFIHFHNTRISNTIFTQRVTTAQPTARQ